MAGITCKLFLVVISRMRIAADYCGSGISEDATVRLWNVAAHQPIGEPLKGHTQAVKVWRLARMGGPWLLPAQILP
jgi:hypothetical protein